MNQLSLVPSCEEHGCLKVWINDRHRRDGGFFRCRECNRLSSLRRNAKNRANPERTAEINAAARARWAGLPAEVKRARNTQVVEQRAERMRRDPKARKAVNDYQNARRASIPLEKHRDRQLRRTYGITHADYDRMLAEQGGGCAICGSTKPNGRSKKYLYVDHCHTTGKVRGILCATCNSGLGSFGDEVGRLLSAAEYLKRHAMDSAA